jgi:hypothetical protein
MCYSVYISTNSSQDFSIYNSELVYFEKMTDLSNNPCITLLEFSHKWYVGSRTGCSCGFRHLASIEFGFSDPVDWYEEEQDDIEATSELYCVLLKLLSSGYHVDIVDLWQGTQPKDIITSDVSLDEISATEFRLFENHKFNLNERLKNVKSFDRREICS